MSAFVVGHATHPDWRSAVALAAAQVDAAWARSAATEAPTLGWVYLTDHYAEEAAELLAELKRRWPPVAWVGTVGVGVAAGGVEYFDEPAVVLMLAAVPASQFELFSGRRKLQRLQPATALVHADPRTPDLAELIADLGQRMQSGYLFGGLAASRGAVAHFADAALEGGLSGVAFAADLPIVSRVTQGCQPVGPARRITATERNLVLELDGRPALQALVQDLGLAELSDLREAMPRLRGLLVGLTDHEALLPTLLPGAAGDAAGRAARARRGQFGAETRVRHLVGLDPGREAVAVAELVSPGMTLAFCQRDVAAARRDLVRACSEIRDELALRAEAAGEPARQAHHAPAASGPLDPLASVRGAVYVSCSGRGGPHFGGPSAELQIVRRALGDVPLVGFFAAGEIAHRQLYGYTGVLTVFADP